MVQAGVGILNHTLADDYLGPKNAPPPSKRYLSAGGMPGQLTRSLEGFPIGCVRSDRSELSVFPSSYLNIGSREFVCHVYHISAGESVLHSVDRLAQERN